MFLASAVTSYTILPMKRVLEIKIISDIVLLVDAVNQRNLITFKHKMIILALCKQIISLHASKRSMLNKIIFNKNTLRKANAANDHHRISVKIAKLGSNKSAWVSALADTGAQSNLWG